MTSPGSPIAPEEVGHIPALSALSLKERTSLTARLKRRTYLPNRLILKRGEKGDCMAFINWGSVKVRTTNSGSQEMVVALLSSGSYFGEIGMITSRPRSFDVMSLSKTEIFELAREDFIAHTQTYRAFSLSLLVAVAGRLDDAGQRFKDLTEQHVPTRLLRVLTQLGTPYMIGPKQVLLIDPRPSQYDLVGLVGASREKVYEALRDMERSGFVEVEKHRIIVHPTPGFLL